MALTKNGYELIRFPMKVMNITQGNNGQFSHQGVNALDLAGKDTGIDPTFAPCTMKIMRKERYDQGNAVFAESTVPVMFADGTVDYAKFMFLHDDYTGDFNVGRIFHQWEEFGDEGTAGRATGNHCHFEVAKGKLVWDKAGSGYWYYGRNPSTGVWHLQDSISADRCCVTDDVKILDGDGMNWKTSKDLSGSSDDDIQNDIAPVQDENFYGLDLSMHNGNLDFNQLKLAGNAFVILRAGYGWSVENKDPKFEEYYQQAKALGFKIGCYWYSYGRNLEEARLEAECFKQVIQGKSFDFGVWVDLEDADHWKQNNGKPSGAAQAQVANLIADEMKKAGYQTGIYASTYWIDHIFTGLDIKNHLLWEANYGANDGQIHSNHSNRSVLHQYTSQWSAQGKVFDRNICYKDPFKANVEPTKKEPKEEAEGSVYRLYNPNNGDHLYTVDFNEAKAAQKAGWKYEGVGWVSKMEGHPVFRLISPAGMHHFTVNENEKDHLVKLGWTLEGTAFYSDGGKTIYRMYNPNSGSHILTGSRKEHDALSKIGWYCEGTGVYGE